jgi:hypothetical protein
MTGIVSAGQPAGTLIETPAGLVPVPPDRQCSEHGCERQRDHKQTGRCDRCERQARAGQPCRPVKRGNRSVTREQVPIESLRPGDMVCTYDNSQIFMRGRPVVAVTRNRRPWQLVTAATGSGWSSSYAAAHPCIVRIGHELDGKHVVYLMRQGDRFRIGRVPLFYRSQANAFGLGMRAAAEAADAAWILSVHDCVKDAALAEALAQHEFNIPGVRFTPSNRDVMDIRAFWDKHGPNQDRAENCLTSYDRLPSFPLWTAGRTDPIGVRRPFITAAANLLDGFKVLPIGNAIRHRSTRDYAAPAQQWETITVSRTWFYGEVLALEVADHCSYFADGILTGAAA